MLLNYSKTRVVEKESKVDRAEGETSPEGGAQEVTRAQG